MKKQIVIGLLAATGFFCTSAQALDVSGDWKIIDGKSQGALGGQPKLPGRAAGDQHIFGEASEIKIPMVLKINSQKGNSLHGQWCHPKKCEKVVGVIRKDGSILMADEDSTYLGTMYGNEMELCVTQPGKSLRIAICHMMGKVEK